MSILNCSKCNIPMQESTMAAAIAYNNEMKYLISSKGLFDTEHAPNYIIFSCPKCKQSKKLSFEEYFKSRQEIILKAVASLRAEASVSTLDKRDLKEESGMGYCGVCPGFFDGDGYCNKDIMKVCTVRRKVLGI